MAWRISGVSEGLGEATFRGAGDFSVFAAAFVFFFVFGLASLAADFFFGFASGVSFGVAVDVASSSVFFFAFGDGEPDFPLYGQPFGFALGLGDWVGSGVSRGGGFAFGLGAGEASFFVFDFCRAVFAFAAGLGDSSGDGDAVARAFRNCARFSSSVNCAWTNVPTVALSANRIASQNRKRPTAAHRNRARRAINPERFRGNARKILLAKTFGVQSQAGCVAGVDARVVAVRSRSRRRIAFNLPPRSKKRQVRYIQVKRMIIDASAR